MPRSVSVVAVRGVGQTHTERGVTMHWGTHRTKDYSTTSCWPRWYIGFDCGRWGLGVVREQWGWRIMLGTLHICGHDEDRKGA